MRAGCLTIICFHKGFFFFFFFFCDCAHGMWKLLGLGLDPGHSSGTGSLTCCAIRELFKWLYYTELASWELGPQAVLKAFLGEPG